MEETLKSFSEAKKLIDAFYSNKNNKRLIDRYHHETFFDMIGGSRSESVHSNFLSWILNQNHWSISSDRHLVLDLLYCIQKRADKSINKENCFPKKLIDALACPEVSFKYKVDEHNQSIKGAIREYPLKEFTVEKKRGFVDLHILGEISCEKETFPVRIIIENKIDSRENPHQTDKYYAYFSGNLDYLNDKRIKYGLNKNPKKQKNLYRCPKLDNEIQVFVYLTANSNYEIERLDSKEIGCECEYFIHINYQDLLDDILLPLVTSNSINPRDRYILNEYIDVLSFTSISNNHITQNMAIKMNDSKMLIKFWDDNQAIIMASLEALRKDVDAGDIDKDEVSTVIESIKKVNSSRDYSKYRIDDSPVKYNKRQLIDKLVKDYVTQNPNITIDELIRVFPKFEKNDCSDAFQVIYDYIPNSSKEYNSFILGKHLYFINSQWTLPKVERLINHLNDIDGFPFQIYKI